MDFDSETKMNMELEKMEIDEYFERVDIEYIHSLYELLTSYLQNIKIVRMIDKHNKMKDSLFIKKDNKNLYRGFIRYNYIDCSNFQNLGNCLYITHIMIYPRRGDFFKPTLKKILYENDNIDSIFIEAILSDKVLQSFIDNGWNIINNSCFITKKNIKRVSFSEKTIKKVSFSEKTIKRVRFSV